MYEGIGNAYATGKSLVNGDGWGAAYHGGLTILNLFGVKNTAGGVAEDLARAKNALNARFVQPRRIAAANKHLNVLDGCFVAGTLVAIPPSTAPVIAAADPIDSTIARVETIGDERNSFAVGWIVTAAALTMASRELYRLNRLKAKRKRAASRYFVDAVFEELEGPRQGPSSKDVEPGEPVLASIGASDDRF